SIAYGVECDNGALRNVGNDLNDQFEDWTLDVPSLRFLVVVDEGDSTNCVVYMETDTAIEDIQAVKISLGLDVVPVTNATLSEETIDGDRYVLISYELVDGGINDQDGIVNGLIADPV